MSNKDQWQVIHFTDQACAVCDIVGIKLSESLQDIQGVTYVPIEAKASPDLAAKHTVVQFPTVLLEFEGQVYKRYERVFSVDQLLEDLKRYVALSQ